MVWDYPFLGWSIISSSIVDKVNKRWTVFLERTREGHRQSDEHWNHFKGEVGETSERWGGTHMGFSKCIDTILNWTEQVMPNNSQSIPIFPYCPCHCCNTPKEMPKETTMNSPKLGVTKTSEGTLGWLMPWLLMAMMRNWYSVFGLRLVREIRALGSLVILCSSVWNSDTAATISTSCNKCASRT